MSEDSTARGLASGVLGWCPSPRELEISRRRQHGEKKDRQDVGEKQVTCAHLSKQLESCVERAPSQDGWALPERESSGTLETVRSGDLVGNRL